MKETFERVLPAKRELLKKVKSHADKKLGEVKVENALGGMRYARRTCYQEQVTNMIAAA